MGGDGDPPPIPAWLSSLPLAPEYRPTETEFADPIAFISRVERAAAAFGICKVVPPLPRPSKKLALANLNRSLLHSPDLPSPPAAAAAVFTTRHQELGSRRPNKHVWQSGERYTLAQFEAKSRDFSRSQLPHCGADPTPFLIESFFWRANAADKPISVEYANDVPGSGFSAPCRRTPHCQKSRAPPPEGLSDSPWNLQAIARAPGSLTRFMPDDVPGVTSPMVYIGMLYSWFAWHVEDHELHSLNFLHVGAPKTWYAVPGEYAGAMEEIVRVQAYGENVDRLAALTMLGEKTNLLCPEVLVQAGIPCCRLVQHPGEFVVTFPRAYHVGFSHGFNCGEAANFATSQWLRVAKEAAVRRAAMNYLPMLSHQQLLYMLTMSFVFRIPRELILGVRSSRLRDRLKEEREISIKKAFLNDLMNENCSLCILLKKKSTFGAVLWDPVLLPTPTNVSQSFSSSSPPEAHSSVVLDTEGNEIAQCRLNKSICNYKKEDQNKSERETLENFDADVDDLPFGLNLDSGSLACVACGVLGYPFMVIIQPSERAMKELLPVSSEHSYPNLGASGCSASCPPSQLANITRNFDSDYLKGSDAMLKKQGNPDSNCELLPELSNHVPGIQRLSTKCDSNIPENEVKEFFFNSSLEEINQSMRTMSHQVGSISSRTLDHCSHSADDCSTAVNLKMNSVNDRGNRHTMRLSDTGESVNMISDAVMCNESSCTNCTELVDERDKLLGAPIERSHDKLDKKWNLSNGFLRPRIFCLQHAVQIERLLQSKGGAHVLIICYSDYLKIKPQIFALAEEIGIQLNFSDVPIENASPADLDLINISIDEDEYEEHGEDWTSKLGLNLKYCVKLRKQSSSNQESSMLALSGIFSDLHPSFPVSRLKWNSRKTRTPKLYFPSQSISHANAGMEKGNPAVRKSDAEIQVYQICKSNVGEVTGKRRGRPRKDVPKEASTTTSLVESSQENQEISAIDKTPNDSMGVQENKIEKDLILENSQDYSLPSDDLQIIRTSSVNESGMEVAVSDTEEPKIKDGSVDSLKSGLQSDNNYPEVAIQHAGGASEREHNPSYMICGMQVDNQCKTYLRVTNSSKMDDDVHSLTVALNAKDHNNVQLEGHLAPGGIFEDSGAQMNEGNVVSAVDNSVNIANRISLSVVESCEMRDIIEDKMDGNAISLQKVIESDTKRPTIVYTRRADRNKNKRKREDMITNDQDYRCFVRGPCEGLRPRSGQKLVEHKITSRITKINRSVVRRGKDNGKGVHKCGIEGCHLSFRTRGELKFHEGNFCIFKGCRKRFNSHRHLVCHHQVHEDERPLKCPWKGCGMSFKWAWARTEHLRLHTGERPYKCKTDGCGQTFRFMSDFCRHRRKMGHSVT